MNHLGNTFYVGRRAVERQLFSFPIKAISKIDSIFDWNIQDENDFDMLEMKNFNRLIEQWQKIMCTANRKRFQTKNEAEKIGFEDEEKIETRTNKSNSGNETKMESDPDMNQFQNQSEQQSYSSCECHSDPNLDFVLRRQLTHEIDLNSETCSQVGDESTSQVISTDIERIETPLNADHQAIDLDTLIVDLLDDRVTTETLSKNYQQLLAERKNDDTSRKSASTSPPSSPIPDKQPTTICDFLNQMFLFENDTSKRYTLGKYEHWIAAAEAAYVHPFDNHLHQQCLVEKGDQSGVNQ